MTSTCLPLFKLRLSSSGVISALTNLSRTDLQLTLAVSFNALSLAALALNALIGRQPRSFPPPAV
ncbi:hypothetical protein AQS70_18930 [Pseudomonas endophytica]|uniref:Uncharacterized protein n=1 Tax=Pseudomonas endophytica TaxID=1563157 RepID=A0A0Q0XX07_9PSED|nr:hypothetical protein [Pseudomonas endophytica]KQB55271.1 hypothetical protein AQS70_18930 [Pseudomonas endophytica]